MRFPKSLKSFPLAVAANQKRRALEVEYRYRVVSWLASKKRVHGDLSLGVLDDLMDTRDTTQPWRVLFCGTDPLQDYGGFVQSLSRFCDLEVLGGVGEPYGQDLTLAGRVPNHQRIVDSLENMSRSGRPADIILGQFMGLRTSASDLHEIKAKFGVALINVDMDSRLTYRYFSPRRRGTSTSAIHDEVDLALVTAPEIVSWYRADGVAAKYFPLATDADIYYPIPGREKTVDVGFVGRAYGARTELAKKFENAGIRFTGRGPGWPLGPITPDDCNEFYNSSRVVLGAGQIGYSKRLMNPKLRDFEVPMSGSLYVTNRTPELSRLFTDRKEILMYDSDDELIELVKYYVRHDEEREEIATLSRARAIRDHQLDQRFAVLFNQLLAGDKKAEFV